MRHITLAGRKFRVPASRPLRLATGGALVVMGLFGFLPVLGFWMIPVGLTVLSADLPIARRLRRRMDVIVTRRWRSLRGSAGARDSQP
jgi:hypothetical protein